MSQEKVIKYDAVLSEKSVEKISEALVLYMDRVLSGKGSRADMRIFPSVANLFATFFGLNTRGESF